MGSVATISSTHQHPLSPAKYLAALLLLLMPLWVMAQSLPLEPPLKRNKPAKSVTIDESTKDKPRLEIAVHNWAPYAGANLSYLGIAPRLVNEVIGRDGTQTHLRFMHWSKALDMLANQEVDAAIIWVSDDLRMDDFVASTPLLKLQAILYSRADKPLQGGLPLQKNLRLAWVPEYVYDSRTYTALSKHLVTAVPARNEREAMQLLLDKKADAFLTPYSTGRNTLMALTASQQKQLVASMQTIPFPSAYLLVNKQRADASTFMKNFNQGLRRLQQDGRYERITELPRG